MELAGLRERLTKLDAELLALVAERQRLSEEVARAKRTSGLPTRDFSRERDVLLHARETAANLGLSPALAETLLRLLIRSSLATQEQAQVAAQGQGAGRRALVIGGRGKMGRWFVEFLDSQGYAVEVADPAGPLGAHPHRNDWQSDELAHEVIVVATPFTVSVTAVASLTVPLTTTVSLLVDELFAGSLIVSDGAVASSVMVRVMTDVLVAASVAVSTSTFAPAESDTLCENAPLVTVIGVPLTLRVTAVASVSVPV